MNHQDEMGEECSTYGTEENWHDTDSIQAKQRRVRIR
jgi:hypothetical protein